MDVVIGGHERRRSRIGRHHLSLPILAIAAAAASVGALLISLDAAHPKLQPRLGAEVPVTAMALGLEPANNSPILAADPNDPRFVVLANRLDAPDFGCALQLSGGGGGGWLSVNPVPELPAGVEKCYGPEVAFDDEGNLYYLFVGLAGAGNRPVGAFLTRSADRGQTFSPPLRVLGPLNFGVRMAIDRSLGDKGRVHLVWLAATSSPTLGGFGPPPNPIMSAHSDDGGRTFSKPVQVSDSDRSRVVAPALALGPEKAVYVAYYDLRDDALDYQGLEGEPWEGQWALVVAASSDGGRTFRRGSVVDDAIVPAERVMLVFTMPPPALAAEGPHLCGAWTDARHGDADVLIRCSHNRARSWSQARRVNDDAVSNGRNQYLPALSASSGRVHAVFLDRRDDAANLQTATYYAYSDDGGRSFGKNLKLSSEPFDPRIGQRYLHPAARGLVEIGSRLAVLAWRDSVLAAWPDTRNARSGMTEQDLFARHLELAGSRGDGARTEAMGWGLIILALGGFAFASLLAVRQRLDATRAPVEPGISTSST